MRTARVVASICRRLDGVALALEARSASMLRPSACHRPLRFSTSICRWGGWGPHGAGSMRCCPVRNAECYVALRSSWGTSHWMRHSRLSRTASPRSIDSLQRDRQLGGKFLVAIKHPWRDDALSGIAYDTRLRSRHYELAGLAVRHATYYQRWLAQSATESATLTTSTEGAPHMAVLDDARAALEWCSMKVATRELGWALPPLQGLPFWQCRCYRNVIAGRTSTSRSRRCCARRPEEMHLQAVSEFTDVSARKERCGATALKRSVTIAEECGDPISQVGLLMLRTSIFAAGILKPLYFTLVVAKQRPNR